MADVKVFDSTNEPSNVPGTGTSFTPLAEVYKYNPLPFPDSIRVLILNPSKDSKSVIICELCHIRLCQAEDYKFSALSYVWGDAGGNRTIRIDSPPSPTTPHQEEMTHLPIHKNLDDALRHLRRPKNAVRLWVDAVCIDQSSMLERNHQVQQMRDIYQSAWRTIIYLGPQQNGFTGVAAWNYLERNSSWAWNEDLVKDWTLPARMEEEIIDFRGELKDVEIDVLNRTWFRRVWVLQEVVVSRDVEIQCGYRRVSWDDFCRNLLLSPRYHDQYGNSLASARRVDVVREMFHARCAFLESRGLGKFRPSWYSKVESYHMASSHVLDMLARGRLLQASNPKDKIFALLGISTGFDLNDPRFAIDYSKSCVEVYTDFAKHMIETTNAFDVLSYVDEYTTERLPTWVPNWNQSYWNNKHTSPTILSTLEAEPQSVQEKRKHMVKSSCTFAKTTYPISPWENDTKASFFVLGSSLGVIVRLGPKIQLEGRDELTFQRIRDRYYNNPAKQYQKVFNTWASQSHTSDLAPRFFSHFPHFSSLVSMDRDPPKMSVEHHLFKRARRTANWTDNENKAADVIIDYSSVVDGKLIAVYTSLIGEPVERLAILPPRAREGDYIVAFRGARVPYVVRKMASAIEEKRTSAKEKEKGQEKDGLLHIYNCYFVGECLANGIRDFVTDEVGREDSNSLMRNMQGFLIN